MAFVSALREYGSSSEDSESSEDSDFIHSHLKPLNKDELVNQNLAVAVVAAPDVIPNVSNTYLICFKRKVISIIL